MDDKAQYIDTSPYSKSKSFLFPILGLSRKEIFRPEGSYLFFQDHNILNNELVVYYKHDGSQLYHNFEQYKLAGHPMIRACYRVPEGTIYVFNISEYKYDVNHFLGGDYSKMSEKLKGKILTYFGDSITDKTPKAGRTVHSALYPELYKELIANQLGVHKNLINELAPIYDLDTETLTIETEEFQSHKC